MNLNLGYESRYSYTHFMYITLGCQSATCRLKLVGCFWFEFLWFILDTISHSATEFWPIRIENDTFRVLIWIIMEDGIYVLSVKVSSVKNAIQLQLTEQWRRLTIEKYQLLKITWEYVQTKQKKFDVSMQFILLSIALLQMPLNVHNVKGYLNCTVFCYILSRYPSIYHIFWYYISSIHYFFESFEISKYLVIL